jgi:hypothetical protein
MQRILYTESIYRLLRIHIDGWVCRYKSHYHIVEPATVKGTNILWQSKLMKIILLRIDTLLGKDLETNNETTAVAMQRSRKHASTTVELLLETVLFAWFVPRSYFEDNCGDTVSCQLSVESWDCEDRTWAQEAEESTLLEAVTRKRLVRTHQAGKGGVMIFELWRLAVAL